MKDGQNLVLFVCVNVKIGKNLRDSVGDLDWLEGDLTNMYNSLVYFASCSTSNTILKFQYIYHSPMNTSAGKH